MTQPVIPVLLWQEHFLNLLTLLAAFSLTGSDLAKKLQRARGIPIIPVLLDGTAWTTDSIQQCSMLVVSAEDEEQFQGSVAKLREAIQSKLNTSQTASTPQQELLAALEPYPKAHESLGFWALITLLLLLPLFYV